MGKMEDEENDMDAENGKEDAAEFQVPPLSGSTPPYDFPVYDPEHQRFDHTGYFSYINTSLQTKNHGC